MTHTATYSPDDNKLRLSPAERLDPEWYARVKAAGFAWAPQQGIFVSGRWTPEREDLLMELCGAIDDEDQTLTDRAEDRAARFEDYHDKRTAEAERAQRAVSQIADGIPLGQPILVGHHSERHARRDAERIENGMRNTIHLWETAEYWTRRAAGAIQHAKYKERPDVRARRIKTIEAEQRKTLREIADAEREIKIWGLVFDDAHWKVNPDTGERPSLQARAERITDTSGDAYRSYPLAQYPRDPRPGAATVYEGPISTRSALQDGIITPQQAHDLDVAAAEQLIVHLGRWRVHQERRLLYERALLADAGGTVADKTGPEKGGAVRCWASPAGGWSYIVKVNKISVTVWDNWHNGGPNFSRVIPFDKLAGVMSRAQVEAARAERRILEMEGDSTGKVIGFRLLRADPPAVAERVADCMTPAPEPEPDPPPAVVDVTDTGEQQPRLPGDVGAVRDQEVPDVPMPLADVFRLEAPPETQPAQMTMLDQIALMRQTLQAGIKVAIVPQLFPTPADLADQVIRLADIQAGDSLLEPSAGTGSLLAAVRNRFGAAGATVRPGSRVRAIGAHVGQLHIVELNRTLAGRLRDDYPGATVFAADFLNWPAPTHYDRIVMNPPFQRGADIQHVQHAAQMLNPGGRLVAIVAGGPRQRAAFHPDEGGAASLWIDHPADSFPGTSVRTATITIEAAR